MCPIESVVLVDDSVAKDQERNQGQEEHRRAREGERSLIMSLHEVVHPPPSPPPPDPQPQSDHLPSPLLDHISSPVGVQLFDFCDPDIFSDALQTSEVTSSPNCCGYEDQNSSYPTNLIFHSDIANLVNSNSNSNSSNNNKFVAESFDISNLQGDHQNDHTTNTSTITNSTPTVATTISTSTPHHNGAFLFESPDEIDNDISASIDFSPSPSFTAAYNFNNNFTTTSSNNTTQQEHHHHYQLPLSDHNVSITSTGPHQYPTTPVDPSIVLPLLGAAHAPLGTVFEDDSCLSPIPPFLRGLNTPAVTSNSSSSSCSFLDRPIGSFLPGNLNQGLGSDNSSIFTGNLLMSSELPVKELDFHGDNGSIFCPDQLPRVFNSGDMQQGFSNESSQLVSGATSSAPLATTEISSLPEDSNFKVGKLSAEQRKEKIHRYMKKRTERNFSKKIKYACRKTLADSRPRVRGRFAKNDDFGDTNHSHRHNNVHHHEEDDYDEVQQVKEEHEMVDSSDIFSQFSGVNSFKCNYQLQSWI